MLTGDYRHSNHGHNESKITLDMIKGYHILQSNATARRLTNADLPHIHQFAHLLLKINKDGKLIAGKQVLKQIGPNRRITIIKDPTIETKTKASAPKAVPTTPLAAGAGAPPITPDTTLPHKNKAPLDPTITAPTAAADDIVCDVGQASEEELADMLLDLQIMADYVHEDSKKAKEEHVSKISSSAQQVFKGKVAAFSGKNQEKRTPEQAHVERNIIQQQQSAERARERQKKLQQKRAEKNEQDELKAAEKNKEADKFDDKRAQIKKGDVA